MKVKIEMKIQLTDMSTQFSCGSDWDCKYTFTGGWVGGWPAGEIENKAISASALLSWGLGWAWQYYQDSLGGFRLVWEGPGQSGRIQECLEGPEQVGTRTGLFGWNQSQNRILIRRTRIESCKFWYKPDLTGINWNLKWLGLTLYDSLWLFTTLSV